MKQHWYYNLKGSAEGPFDADAMSTFLLQGHLQPDTLIWQPHLAAWQPLGQTQPDWSQADFQPQTPPVSIPTVSKASEQPALKPKTTTTVSIPPITPKKEKIGLFNRLFTRKK